MPENYYKAAKAHPHMVAYIYLGWHNVSEYEGEEAFPFPVSTTISAILSDTLSGS